MKDLKPITPTALTNFQDPNQKVGRLFELDKITADDIGELDNPERYYLSETCSKILRKLNGSKRDNFLDKIDQIMPASTKSDIWEYNHSVISSAVSDYLQQHGEMPSKNAIAAQTGLSRQTVAKHFKEFKAHPDFTAQMEQFQFMAPKVLANVFKYALNGDIKAARLYFEMVGAKNRQPDNTTASTQNNYIQINNTILSQENLRQLSAEQLNQIENIITNSEDK